jgi:hypothetical protein
MGGVVFDEIRQRAGLHALLFRKQERDLEAGAKILRSSREAVQPVADATLKLDSLGADSGDLASPQVDGR